MITDFRRNEVLKKKNSSPLSNCVKLALNRATRISQQTTKMPRVQFEVMEQRITKSTRPHKKRNARGKISHEKPSCNKHIAKQKFKQSKSPNRTLQTLHERVSAKNSNMGRWVRAQKHNPSSKISHQRETQTPANARASKLVVECCYPCSHEDHGITGKRSVKLTF